MKFNISKIFSSLALSALLLASCSDWVTPEAVRFDGSYTESNKGDAYYEALRAYKASDHKLSFGWFDGWDIVEGSPSMSASLRFLPDSMDIVSIWSGAGNYTPTKLEDLRFTTEVKGTKVVLCSFLWELGSIYHTAGAGATLEEIREHYGWIKGKVDDVEIVENNYKAIDKWVKDIADSLDFYGFSGIDIDYEAKEYRPDEEKGEDRDNAIMPNPTYFTYFIKEMGKYIGPQSGTGRIFILDGYLEQLPNVDETGKYFDYLVSQAYTLYGATDPSAPKTTAGELQTSRLDLYYNHFKGVYPDKAEFAKRLIFTENLEAVDVCLAGGYFWEDYEGRIWSRSVMPTLVGFATWQPKDVPRIGGFGGYRFSHERGNTPPWKWLRRAIQAANPSSPDKAITEEDFVDGKEEYNKYYGK